MNTFEIILFSIGILITAYDLFIIITHKKEVQDDRKTHIKYNIFLLILFFYLVTELLG